MPFVDLHCDTIARLLACRRAGLPGQLRTGEGAHVTLEKLQRSGYLLQNFALFVNLQGETPPPGEGAGAEDLYRLSMGCRAGSPLEEVLTLADLYWTEMAANEDLAVPVRSFQEMERARQAGRIACLLTVEEGGVCLGSLPLLRTLYRLGVRMLTLTWNYPNELGCPNGQPGRADPAGVPVPGGDGEPGDDPRRVPPVRRRGLGYVPGGPGSPLWPVIPAAGRCTPTGATSPMPCSGPWRTGGVWWGSTFTRGSWGPMGPAGSPISPATSRHMIQVGGPGPGGAGLGF